VHAVCTLNFGLLDEWIGETGVRVWMLMASSVVSVATCAMQIASGNKGFVITLISGEQSSNTLLNNLKNPQNNSWLIVSYETGWLVS
jgi:hypothetical protein